MVKRKQVLLHGFKRPVNPKEPKLLDIPSELTPILKLNYSESMVVADTNEYVGVVFSISSSLRAKATHKTRKRHPRPPDLVELAVKANEAIKKKRPNELGVTASRLAEEICKEIPNSRGSIENALSKLKQSGMLPF